VKIPDQIGLSSPEFRLQQVSEQVVIPVPLAATIQRDHEQIPALHLLQDPP
jgi:hypothetical protein